MVGLGSTHGREAEAPFLSLGNLHLPRSTSCPSLSEMLACKSKAFHHMKAFEAASAVCFRASVSLLERVFCSRTTVSSCRAGPLKEARTVREFMHIAHVANKHTSWSQQHASLQGSVSWLNRSNASAILVARWRCSCMSHGIRAFVGPSL